MSSVAVVILTKNEEIHLRRALRSVADFATEVFVVDSYSSDCTVEIAKSMSAVVLQNNFINQAKQFQWALDNAPITADWVMRLDADEIIEADLASEIRAKLPDLPTDVVGVNLKRKHIFMGRWVRYGGRYPLLMLRIWRQGRGRVEDRWMDEHIVVSGGAIVTFNGGFADHNLKDLTSFTEKHNRYATREAIEILNLKLDLSLHDEVMTRKSTATQVFHKRWVKENVYNRIPFTISAFAYFVWRYFFLLGFLDGRSGLVYHFLQGYWYRFLVGAKVTELERAIKGIEDKQKICELLSQLTGHPLSSAEN